MRQGVEVVTRGAFLESLYGFTSSGWRSGGLEMIRALWKVIMADGTHAPEEDAALLEIEKIFGIRVEDRPV